MANTYTTQQGDAWDVIAFRVYGSEQYTGFLMQANFELAHPKKAKGGESEKCRK